MNREKNKNVPLEGGPPPREIEFSVVNADFGCGKLLSPKSTGTLINRDVAGIGLLTQLPLQPGNIVKFEHDGTTKLGVVMWSVESSDNFRIQVRYL